MWGDRATIIAGSFFLTACAALNNVHDPESGLITRSQVPKILQSIRCELVTFYDADSLRGARFTSEITQKHYASAVANYAYFPLDPSQLSAVFLDLKVIDNIGIPSGSSATTINQTFLSNGGMDKRTWHVGPNIADTNTYELNWPFVVAQSSTLDLTHYDDNSGKRISANDYFPCYHNLPPHFGGSPAQHNLADVEALARHVHPEMENFARIYVDGTEALAGWLIDRSSQLDTALFPKHHRDSSKNNNDERMFPAQMIYTFTVQFGFGGDASLSLITASRWSPVGLDIAGSTQQTSMLTIEYQVFLEMLTRVFFLELPRNSSGSSKVTST